MGHRASASNVLVFPPALIAARSTKSSSSCRRHHKTRRHWISVTEAKQIGKGPNGVRDRARNLAAHFTGLQSLQMATFIEAQLRILRALMSNQRTVVEDTHNTRRMIDAYESNSISNK